MSKLDSYSSRSHFFKLPLCKAITVVQGCASYFPVTNLLPHFNMIDFLFLFFLNFITKCYM